MTGYLYILSNAAYPALLKVGQTTDSPEKRIRQLSSTGVPFPFVLEACFRVKNPKQSESTMHEALALYRSSKDREFFNIDLQSALNIIFPLIIIASVQSSQSLPEKVGHEIKIPMDELLILQKIVSGGISHGVGLWRLIDQFNSNSLEVELLLARLERKKFIKCDRRNSTHGPSWVPTTKGINFLNDNNLVEEWMHTSW
jgi:T5orf172 domain